jgi:hypothetical protein
MKLNDPWNVRLSRLLPYWLTVVAACWTMAFYGIVPAQKASTKYDVTVHKVSHADFFRA